MSYRYVLDRRGEPVLEPDLMTWAKWFETAQRTVARTPLTDDGETYVSTVFLGLDHSFMGGPPILYESMLFTPEGSDDCERYHTRDEALEGHMKMVNDWYRARNKPERFVVIATNVSPVALPSPTPLDPTKTRKITLED